MKDTYVNSGNSSLRHKEDPGLAVGGSISDLNYTFIDYESIPNLPIGSQIVDARLNMTVYSFGDKNPINLHMISEEWQEYTNYSERPAFDESRIYDFKIPKTRFEELSFDFTKIASYWYETGNKNGLCLAASPISYTWFCSSDYNQYEYTTTQHSPVSIYIYYNAKEYDIDGYFGMGFRNLYNQKWAFENSQKYHEDGDGTKHFYTYNPITDRYEADDMSGRYIYDDYGHKDIVKANSDWIRFDGNYLKDIETSGSYLRI